MNIILNGENHHLDKSVTVAGLLGTLGFDERKVAVERNLEIVPKSNYCNVSLSDGDRLEIVHFIGGGVSDDQDETVDDTFEVAGQVFKSRLLVGTGKYRNFEENAIPNALLEGTIVEYEDFLEARRKLMAEKIRDYYFAL